MSWKKAANIGTVFLSLYGTIPILRWGWHKMISPTAQGVSAIGYSLVLLGLICFWAFSEWMSKRTTATAKKPTGSTQPLNGDVVAQLQRLTGFQIISLRILVSHGSMTGDQFGRILVSSGFPIDNLRTQHLAENTFADIASRTTLLIKDDSSDCWSLRAQFAETIVRFLSMERPES